LIGRQECKKDASMPQIEGALERAAAAACLW